MEELTEQERIANEEHNRLAEENKNKPYVDVWKQTRLAKEADQKEIARKKLKGA